MLIAELLRQKLYARTAYGALEFALRNVTIPALGSCAAAERRFRKARSRVLSWLILLRLADFLGWRNSRPHGIGCATGRCASGRDSAAFFLVEPSFRLASWARGSFSVPSARSGRRSRVASTHRLGQSRKRLLTTPRHKDLRSGPQSARSGAQIR